MKANYFKAVRGYYINVPYNDGLLFLKVVGGRTIERVKFYNADLFRMTMPEICEQEAIELVNYLNNNIS